MQQRCPPRVLSGRIREIELELLASDDRLDLVVVDHGAGIALPVPPPPKPSERGGMGFAIIRPVVDELDVRPGGDGDQVLHMTKLARRKDPVDDRWRLRLGNRGSPL